MASDNNRAKKFNLKSELRLPKPIWDGLIQWYRQNNTCTPNGEILTFLEASDKQSAFIVLRSEDYERGVPDLCDILFFYGDGRLTPLFTLVEVGRMTGLEVSKSGKSIVLETQYVDSPNTSLVRFGLNGKMLPDAAPKKAIA